MICSGRGGSLSTFVFEKCLSIFHKGNYRSISSISHRVGSRNFSTKLHNRSLLGFYRSSLFNRLNFRTNTTQFCPNMAPEKTPPEVVCSKFERLPNFAKPVNYKIHLKPCLKTFSFEGEQTIKVEVTKPTNFIRLYSNEIKIKEVHLSSKDGSETFSSLPHEFNEKRSTVDFKLPKQIETGEYNLRMKFDGTLNDKNTGFYRSAYKDHNGEPKYMATTQFESVYARKAFPCFDEPAYKATFDISLTILKDQTGLSCMNEISDHDNGDGTKTLTFATTPIMSPYVLAFVIGDFDFIEGYTSDNVRTRAYTLPGKKSQGEFALEVALKAIPFYSKFFGIPYGLPKCDLIAIPDFNFGAMENWGLITFREVVLLLDPAQTSNAAKEYIALVTAHELAHMWFGNLTSMEWWTDLWLKEGFATFMEYLFTHNAYPEFDSFTQFLSSETLRSMGIDALKSSHPVEVPIENPNEIEEIYDAVSYGKSASLIRMLYDHIGDDYFRDGLHHYLKTFSYRNATTKDLWNCLSTVTKKDISELMSNWTKKMGFPVIKARTSVKDDQIILHMEQDRFLADGSEDAESTLWRIPVTVSTGCQQNPLVKFLLTKKSEEFRLATVTSADWIKLNSGFAGFYKVQYDEEMLRKLMKPIAEKILPAHDRLNICSDLFSLVRCGKMSSVDYLSLLKNFKNETDYTVWAEVDHGVDILDNCLQRTDCGERFRKFCIELYSTIAKNLGWESKPGEGHTVGMLRPLVLRRLAKCGDEETIKTARRYFRAYVDEKKTLAPDLRAMVFGVVAAHDGATAQDELIQIFEKSDFSEVQRHCLSAIGRSSDRKLLEKCCNYTFDTNKVRAQDKHAVMYGITSNAFGQDFGWEYFKTNFKKLLGIFGSADNLLFTHCLKAVVSPHCTEEKAKEFKEFFEANKSTLMPASRPFQQALETVHLNIDLLRRDSEKIDKFLA